MAAAQFYAFRRQCCGQEVHRGRADEAGDEHAGRAVVDVHRRADLLGDAGIHDDQPVGQGHRLDLVVGDVERGDAELALQALDLEPHLHPQLGVEVGERLVEQEDRRLAHDGAAHGDALALAARKLARPAVQEGPELEDRRRPCATRLSISAFGMPRIFRP